MTTEQVNALYIETFYKKPKRINLKVYSHAHEANTAKREESRVKNAAHYKEMEEMH